MRSIVQLSVDGEGRIYAVCDDGTAWWKAGITDHKWEWLPGPPEGEPGQEIDEEEEAKANWERRAVNGGGRGVYGKSKLDQ